MKIGIVTYHRTNNYGACLQAVATRVVLEQMGHEVYYVDYWPKYHEAKYSLFSFYKLRHGSLKSNLRYIIKTLKYFSPRKKRIQNFESFLNEYIYPFCHSTEEEYDAVIYGSDQIWRKQNTLQTYNPFYFGKNTLKTNRHISYAASMGILPSKKEDKEVIKELVSHLDCISVRENELKLFLENLGFHDIYHSLDPTLLLNKEIWDKTVPTQDYTGEKYILVYTIRTNGFDLRQIQIFAERKHLKVKFLRGYATMKETKTNIVSAGPVEFLRLIKNAEYVFTSSFHGLAFSLIYEKQVFASFVDNEGRARSLLSALGIEERLLPAKSPIPIKCDIINYSIVSKKLISARDNSINYLLKSLDRK